MFIITSKAKFGGIWDAKKKCAVKELITSDKKLAEKYKAKGYAVKEEKDKEKDNGKTE